MKPFQNTALLRPLTIEELRLEDPEWVDDHTITFYIPCWFHVNNSAKNGEQDFELEVEIDATTSELLLNQAVEWLQAEKAY